MNFLKTNGKFIGFVFVLVGLLSYANGEIADMEKSVTNQRQRAKNLLGRNLKKLFTDAKDSNGEPATVANRRIQDNTQVLMQTSRKRNQRISFDTSPIYTLASLGDNAQDRAEGYYREREVALRAKMQYLRYITIPNIRDKRAFGFEEPQTSTGMTTQQVEGLLRKMDIVETVAESAGRSNIQRLEKFDFTTGISGAMQARGVPSKQLAGDDAPFIKGESLKVTVYTTEDTLYNFLIELQRPNKGGRPNRYFAIWEFNIQKPDLLKPVDNLIMAEITIVALQINESSSYPLDKNKEANKPATHTGTRRFR